MSRDILFKGITMPESVIAGQYFIISVQAETLSVLYDKNDKIVLDSRDRVMLPEIGEYTSKYTGEEINRFISEVLG